MYCNPANGRVDFVDNWLLKTSLITQDVAEQTKDFKKNFTTACKCNFLKRKISGQWYSFAKIMRDNYPSLPQNNQLC